MEDQDAQWQLQEQLEDEERRAFYAERANREDSYITMSIHSRSQRSSIPDPFALEDKTPDDEVVDVPAGRNVLGSHGWDWVLEEAPPDGFQEAPIDTVKYRGRGRARACKAQAI